MRIKPIVAKTRLVRARRAVRQGIKYKLGKGGYNPSAWLPDSANECDCSGFVAWVLGIRRDQVNAKKWWSNLLPWIETTMVYKDATGPQRLFTELDEPEPGCLVVYGDYGGKEGHIGVVTGVSPFMVVDCSSGQSRRIGEAITERDGGFFLSNPRHIFVCLKEDLA